MKEAFSCGMLCGVIIMLLSTIDGCRQGTFNYRAGVSDTHKEAFQRGFMVKEVTNDDKVIYKWKQ